MADYGRFPQRLTSLFRQTPQFHMLPRKWNVNVLLGYEMTSKEADFNIRGPHGLEIAFSYHVK